MKTTFVILLFFVSAALGTLVDIPPLSYPSWGLMPSTATLTSITLDSANDGVGMFVSAPKDGTITGMRINVTAVTGTAPTYKCWLGTATTGDQINATPVGGGEAVQLETSTWTTGVQTITFGNSYEATAGEMLTLAVMYSSGTVDASNNITIRYAINWLTEYISHPTVATTTAGASSWVDSAVVGPMISLVYSDGTFSTPYIPCDNGHDVASGWDSSTSATTDLWRGTIFTPPFGCRLIGGWVTYRNAGSYGWTGALYSGTTQLCSATFTSDDLQATSAGTLVFIPFDATVLTADTSYYLVMKPDTTSEFTDALTYSFGSSALRAEMFPDMYYAESDAASGGAPSSWGNNDATIGPLIVPVIDQIDIPASGGGGGGRSAGANFNGELQ